MILSLWYSRVVLRFLKDNKNKLLRNLERSTLKLERNKSHLMYNEACHSDDILPKYTIIKVYYMIANVTHFTQGVKRGTFLEAGAYDGEFLSNTLDLELNYHFQGVLIEANPRFFNQLLRKHRKAWALNMCLNVNPWASKV